MFYYYGGKHRLAAHYPPPLHDTIIEPFAGSAAYAMSFVRRKSIRRVVLVEKDPRVVATWRRLLAMTVADLREYDVPEMGEVTNDFLVMTTATSNAIAGCSWMTVTERQPDLMRKMLRRMEPLLEAAKQKVELIEGDYRDAPDVEATWFIDPPYTRSGRASNGTNRPQGMGYAKGCDTDSIDYSELGAWCRTRPGQRIVCEYAGADWLPFKALPTGGFDGLSRSAGEVCWADPEHQMELA